MSISEIRAALIKSELIQAKSTFFFAFFSKNWSEVKLHLRVFRNKLEPSKLQGSKSWLQIQADCLSLLPGFLLCHGPAIFSMVFIQLTSWAFNMIAVLTNSLESRQGKAGDTWHVINDTGHMLFFFRFLQKKITCFAIHATIRTLQKIQCLLCERFIIGVFCIYKLPPCELMKLGNMIGCIKGLHF